MAIRLFLLLSLILGVAVTQYYVVGFELHRFYAPSWVFILVGGVLLISRDTKQEKGKVWILSCLLALTLYFAARGIWSAVPSLMHKEFPVLIYGLLTFLAASSLGRYRRFLTVLMYFSAGLLILQLCYNLIPAEETSNLIKAWGERRGQNGRMFGLFRHYNPFASYCGLSAGVLMALVFLKWRTPFKTLLIRSLLVALAIFSLYGAYKSGSRMGTAVTALSCVLALFGGISLSFLLKDGKVASSNKLMTVVGTAVLGIFLSVGLFTTAFNKASEARGTTGALTDDIMGGMRISSIGMGFSLWLREPLVGSGPRAFSYHSPSLRRTNSAYDKGNHGHPDAEMVHNDWTQTLAEYGVVGLLLVLLSLGSILLFTWRNAWGTRLRSDSWFVAPLAATAAVAGIMLHSIGDFTMHSTPVFVHLSLILGGCYGWVNREPVDPYMEEKKALTFYLKGALILLSLSLFFFVGRRQIIHTPLLIKYDHAKHHQGTSLSLDITREAARKAPDSFMLQELGYTLLKKAPTLQGNEREKCLREAEVVLTQARSLHPYRIEILSNLARVKMELNDLEAAEFFLIEAFQWTGERWKVYHLGPLAESYLTKKADEYWDKRQPEFALAYYLKAKQYNEEGFWRHYQGRGKVREASKERINNNLKVLELGQISPHEDVDFFDGYGL